MQPDELEHTNDALRSRIAELEAEVNILKANRDVYCTQCGVKKGLTNHWWVVFVAPGVPLVISHFNRQLPPSGVLYEEYPCCGEECVLKTVSQEFLSK